MIKVIFFCNWGSNSEELLGKYKLFTPNNKGIFNSLIGVNKTSEADVIIFLEGIPNDFDL